MTSESDTTIIEPASGWAALRLGEVWRYRDLLTLLVWRDVSARYRQSVVGYGWAVLKPVMSMVIYTVIFGRVAGLDSEGIPYALFCMAGLIPWLYFSGALSNVVTSVSGSSALLTKVYFPRLVLPLASLPVGLVELAVQLVILAVMMAVYRVAPGWQIVFLPVFVLGAVAVALAFGLWLAALNVKYRDIGMAAPFFIQIWMWMCPIVYSRQMVPEAYRWLYDLNPLVGIISGFRWSLLGGTMPEMQSMVVSLTAIAVLLVCGLWFFRRTEALFADVV